jgi:predicted dehydrogenase
MGKRRIQLMREFFKDMELCGVDARAQRRDEAADLFGIPCYPSIKQGMEMFCPDSGFVCTSPLSHSAVITELLQGGLDVFTEINLVDDGYEQNTALAQQKGKTLFLSSTPLYRKEIQYITTRVRQTGAPLVYRYHVGQYLPDWHPWENYKDFFVGDKRTNGCREIFGIELPWMEQAFGAIEQVTAQSAKLTALHLDYDDSYLVTLKHAGGISGQLAVNVVSRKAVRDLEIVGERLYLKWLGTPDSLTMYDYESKRDVHIDTYEAVTQDKRYAENIIENAYVDELAAFFDTLAGRPALRHRFADDARVLGIIDEIEGGR